MWDKFSTFYNTHKKSIKIVGVIVLIVTMICTIFASIKYFKDKANEEVDVPPVQEDNREYIMKTLYYVNEQYVQTGNDDYPMVVPVETKVFTEEYATIEEAMIRALYNIPTVENTDYTIRTALTNFKILDVTKEGKIVYVNFSSQGLNGGSMEEVLLYEQIVNTLLTLNVDVKKDESGNEVLDTVENIKSVVFLVDGNKVESLLGHFVAEYTLPNTITQNEIEFQDFSLGAYVDDITEKLGTPLQRNTDWQTNVEEIIYNGVTFMTRDNMVYQITVTSEEYKTNMQIKVGDTVEQVIKVYGQPTSNNKTGTLRYLVGGSEALRIKVNSEGKVSQILIIEP